MRIIGLGIDIVEVERIERMLREHGERFLKRCFTDAECAYATDRRRMAEHLAGRFAAKEAVLKALGTGLTGDMTWRDVEVTRAVSGQPEVRLSGRCAALASQRAVQRWWLSISHTEHYATASVIAEGG